MFHTLNIFYVEKNTITCKHKKDGQILMYTTPQIKTNKHRDSPTGIERLTEDTLFTKSLYRLSCYYLEERLAFPLNLALPATL